MGRFETFSAEWAALCLLGLSFFLAIPVTQVAGAPGNDIAPLLQTAEHEFDLGNYPLVIKTLQGAISQNGASAQAYYWIARSYYEMRDFDNAAAQAEKAVALDVKNSLYHQWLGRSYGSKADRDRSFFLAKKVKKEFEEAIRLNPSNIEARADLEDFCLSAPWIVGGNKDEARDQVDAISALNAVDGHVSRGKFDLEALKKPDLAENEFRQILLAKPKRVEPYLEVIAFFQKQNKIQDMAAAIEDATQMNGNDPRLEYFQAIEWILSGADSVHAEEYLKSYLASTPERSDWPSHATAREWLGRLYESQGKRAEAAEQYRAALQLEPGRKEILTRLERLEKSLP